MEYVTLENQAIEIVTEELWLQYVDCKDLDQFSLSLGI